MVILTISLTPSKCSPSVLTKATFVFVEKTSISLLRSIIDIILDPGVSVKLLLTIEYSSSIIKVPVETEIFKAFWLLIVSKTCAVAIIESTPSKRLIVDPAEKSHCLSKIKV